MKHKYVFSSVTRISNLQNEDFTISPLSRNKWRTGDYVVGEVQDTTGRMRNIELPNGRMVEIYQGDHIIGALGKRTATLEAVGDWEAIGDDLRFEALTSAGLFGKTTSCSVFLPPLMSLVYKGHVKVANKKLNMQDCVKITSTEHFDLPVILLVGTSMSAGKTTTGKIIIHLLKDMNYRVAGVKLTGAARYRDVLSFGDAGADYIYDFVDAGLPSTVCDKNEFIQSLEILLGKIADLDVDVVVAEAGASPLEPYNGATAIDKLKENICYKVLCASDPYAVAGVASAFQFEPDLVSGGAANTSAAIDLVDKLTGYTALNLLDKNSINKLKLDLEATISKWV
jgi:hypothetical protein